MSYRIFMTISRGTMDKTAACVFPWERMIIEEIHGGGAQIVSIEEMASLKEASKVVTVKLSSRSVKGEDGKTRLVTPDLAPSLREQLESMSRVDAQFDPLNNVDEEWNRLCDKYGMHKDVKLPVCEKVYGSVTNFRQIVRAYRGNTPPKEDPLYPGTDVESEAEADADDLAPDDMTAKQLRAALDARGVEYGARDARDKLIELLTEQIAA